MPAVPCSRGWPLFGHLFDLQRDPTGFLMSMARRYGPIANYRVAGQNVFLLDHPDSIREVLQTQARKVAKSPSTRRMRVILGEGLLTSEGEFHHRQRRLAQPAFYRPRLEQYARVMAEDAAELRDGMREGQQLDMDREMMRLTLSIVTRTLFSAGEGIDAREIGEAVTGLLQLFPLLVMPYSEYLHRFPVLPVSRRMIESRNRLDRVVMRLIADRRAAGEDRGDLLSMLISARDEEDGSAMSDRQIRDEVLTLFLAGHETTAVALSWAWYLLSQHPAIEERLHREVDEVLQGRPATLQDVERLAFTTQVLAETMRLYPPAWGMAREAVEEMKFAGSRFAKGTIFVVSPYVTHRNPAYWPEPERFDPGRFTPEAQASRPKFAYFPFGGGPRVCIGERFAWMEGVLILATLSQRWSFRLLPGQMVEPRPLITLRPKNGIRMEAASRAPLIDRPPGAREARA